MAEIQQPPPVGYEQAAEYNIAVELSEFRRWNRATGIFTLLFVFKIATTAWYGFSGTDFIELLLIATVIGLCVIIAGLHNKLAGFMTVSVAVIKQARASRQN